MTEAIARTHEEKRKEEARTGLMIFFFSVIPQHGSTTMPA